MANFKTALEWLKNGKKVYRRVWNKYADAPKYFYLGHRNIHNQDKKHIRLCNIHSFEADDWEIYKEKKIIEIEITQKMCDELNNLQDKLFRNLSEDTKRLLNIKEHKPCKVKALIK